jgi:hypothetical protein
MWRNHHRRLTLTRRGETGQEKSYKFQVSMFKASNMALVAGTQMMNREITVEANAPNHSTP